MLLRLWVLGLLISTNQAAELVQEGTARCVIVISDRPSDAAAAGAHLLARQLARISGANVRVLKESALQEVSVAGRRLSAQVDEFRPATFVLVGESTLSRRLQITADTLDGGAIRLRRQGNVLVLLGADRRAPEDPWGSYYAVVTYLEELLGVRYLWPGELGLIVPAQTTIPLPVLNKTHSPPVIQRGIRWSSRNERVNQGLAYLGLTPLEYDFQFQTAIGEGTGLPRWTDWQRLGGTLNLNAGHSFGDTWEKYHESHPEWFALQPNGSRDLTGLNPERPRLCKSNPDLLAALARDKIAELDRSGATSVSLVPSDGGRATFCLCDECRKLDPPEGRPMTLTDYTQSPPRDIPYVSLTDRMVWFWNQLASRINAERPDARFVVYAYSAYAAPPVRERLDPRIAVGLVSGTYDNEAARQQALTDWEAWSNSTQQLYWRPNLLLYGAREGVPSVFIHKLAEDIRGLTQRGLTGTDFDSIVHHWATEGLNYYVLARLLWDPDQDVDAILQDYCESGFGLAAERVKQYFLRIEQITDEVAASAGSKLARFSPEVCAELHALLDEAAAMADDELVRQRVEFLRTGVDFVELQARTHAFAEAHQRMNPSDEQLEAFQAEMQAKFELMRHIVLTKPLAISTPAVAWGSEGRFRQWGWIGVESFSARQERATSDDPQRKGP